MPNNRQLSIIAWTAVALAFAMAHSGVRTSIKSLARSLLAPMLLVPIAGFLLSIWMSLVAGKAVGVWNSNLSTDTLFWIVGSGTVLFGSFDDAHRDPQFFRTKVGQVLGVTVLVGVILEVSILPLAAELVLVPGVAIVALLTAVARLKKEQAQVARLANGCLVIIGLAILAYGSYRIVFHWNDVDAAHLLRQALLPI